MPIELRVIWTLMYSLTRAYKPVHILPGQETVPVQIIELGNAIIICNQSRHIGLAREQFHIVNVFGFLSRSGFVRMFPRDHTIPDVG